MRESKGPRATPLAWPALHPDVEEAGEKFGERGLIEIEFGLDLF
jgi:hypothetical protein